MIDPKRKYKSEDWFIVHYQMMGKSITQIARELDVHRQTIYSYAQYHGYKLRKRTNTKRTGEFKRMMSEKRMGVNNPNWKGGINKAKGGYVKILKRNHPFCDVKGYVAEHRLVIEKKLGRYLHPTEIVHHLNGNKQDNETSNLELRGRGNHHRIKFHCPHCGNDILSFSNKNA